MTSPRRVAALRATYKAIVRTRVSDDADIVTQHAWWRLHDKAKAEYARADWQWESFVLRLLIGVVVALGVTSLLYPSVIPLAVIVSGLTFAQCYRIFTRSAPD